MELSLPAKFRKLIEDRVRSGKYATPEDVVKAAVTTLDQNDRFGDFAPGELDRLIEEGEQSLKRDGPIAGESVFKALRSRGGRLSPLAESGTSRSSKPQNQ
jgi:Arc/MetJ-type ribon-helix-helix transcriptional regulator